jgi:hypothetical protein
MDYKFKYLKYKIKCEKMEKKIYEYIEKNNIDIKNVYKLINKHTEINDEDVDNIITDTSSDNNMMQELYENLK